MTEFVVKFLTAGLGGLVGNGLDLFGQNIVSFQIGDAFGFEPVDNETTARGNITFVGGREDIKVNFNQQTASISVGMIVPEAVDDLDIGNVVVFVRYGGKVIPFAMIVLSELIVKQNVSTDIFDQLFPYPGTRLIINLNVKYVSLDTLGAEVVVDIHPVDYANLPMYGDQTQVPDGDANPWPQFILNGFSLNGGSPTLVVKDDNGLHFGSPLFQNIDSPKYGILDGGADASERVQWIWGGRYDYDDQLYSDTVIGGADYLDDGESIIIGGHPY